MPRKRNGLKAEELAKLLPAGECTVYRWIADDLIPYIDHRIPRAFAKRMKKLWDKTCTPSEASRILEVSTTKIDDMLDEGSFRTTTLGRKTRIFRDSLAKAKKKGFLVQKSDIAHPNRRGFARLKKAKLGEISKMGNHSLKRREPRRDEQDERLG